MSSTSMRSLGKGYCVEASVTGRVRFERRKDQPESHRCSREEHQRTSQEEQSRYITTWVPLCQALLSKGVLVSHKTMSLASLDIIVA